MGTDVHLLGVGAPADALVTAAARIHALERRWSRFLPHSEVSRLNASRGPAVVSAETFALVSAAVDAWWATAGRFDPTVLPAVAAAGYDRPFSEVGGAAATSGAPPPGATPGCAGIMLGPAAGVVALPPGVEFDPGGIGKGLAADWVVEQLLAAGAAGACANIGGDLRVAGTSPEDGGWVVTVEDPLRPPEELLRLGLAEGAVATSSRLRRRWQAGGEERHHLIDPSTGAPSATAALAATAVAGTACAAEVTATAAFLAGPDEAEEVFSAAGAAGVMIDQDGAAHAFGVADYLT